MGQRIEVSEENIEQIKKLASIGYGRKRISKILNLTEGVICRIMREQGIKVNQAREISISREELDDLYNNKGYSMSKIAQLIGCNKRDISKKLKEYSIKVHHVGFEPIPFTKELLEEMYLKGNLTQKEIAKRMNCSISVVGKYLKKFNIQERRNRIPIERLRKLYVTEHLSIEEIAKLLGFNGNSIQRKLIDLGLISVNSCSSIDSDKLIGLVLQGLDIKNIAKKLKCSQRVVLQELERNGLKIKKHSLEGVSYDTLHSLLVTQGKSLKEVASLYFVSDSTLKVYLKSINLSVMKEKALLREKALSEETLKDLYFNRGMTQKEIASHLNVAREQVIKKFKEYNISKPDKWEFVTKEKLIELYVNQNMPPCLIAEQLQVPNTVIRDKISSYNLLSLKTPKQIQACKDKAYERALSTSRSKGEIEIEELFPTPHHNVHSVINLELDLWYPKEKVAIEYNGDYWHSIKFPRNSGLHLAKLSMCNNKGVQLINIFERDWHCARSKKLLQIHLQRVLTPETLKRPEGEIRKISNYKENTFSSKYNLNNKHFEGYCLGLYKNTELISSVVYNIEEKTCKIHRYSTHKDYLEDYTLMIQYLLNEYKLPVVVQYDNRYYKKFPCSLEVANTKEIEPQLFYVKSRKALRKEEATPEYLSHSKCRAVYDCGFTEVKYI